MADLKKSSISKRHIFLIGTFTIIILLAGALEYSKYDSELIRTQKYNELKTISGIKAEQITEWYADECSDAIFISKNRFLTERIERYLKTPNEFNTKQLREMLRELRIEHNYLDICVADIFGNILVCLDSTATVLSPNVFISIKKSVQIKNLALTDIYHCRVNDRLRIDLISPFLNHENESAAVLIFRLDPESYLYPLIQSWPSDSKTSETLLVRQDEDSVVFLNKLRHVNSPPLSLKLSLGDSTMPAVKAVMGYEGIWEGPDYRNVIVLSDIKHVPGTAWYMIAKVDTEEIFAELYYRQFVIIVFTLLLILLSGVGLTLVYQSRQRKMYKQLFIQEKVLSEKEEEFRITLYSIGDGVITTDPNGLIKQMNIVAEELTGWSENDAKGKSLEQVFHIINENTREPVENPVHKVIKKGIIVGLANHTLLVNKNGKEIPIADSGAPIKNEDGAVLGVVLIFRDQTAERESKRMIKENENNFKQLLEHSPIGIFFKDDNLRYVKANSFFESLFEVSLRDIIGKNIDAFLPADISKRILDEEKKLIAEKKVLHKQEHVFNKTFATIKFPIEQTDGKVYLAGFVMDITENKLAEENLRKLNRGIEQNPVSIVITDNRGCIQYTNPKFTETTGYQFSEVENKLSRILRPGKLPNEKFQSVWKCISEGRTWQGEFQNKRKNGELYWESVTIAPIFDEYNSISNYIIMNQEITELKNLIEQLVSAKDSAEKADRLKSEFLAQMSHEIRTPINTIMSFISLIKDELAENTDESIKESFKIIELGSMRITRTIDSILNMSELQAGSYETKYQTIELCSGIIEPLYTEFKQFAQNKSLNLELRLNEKPITLNCDVYTTSQLFANIIDNAIKYTKEGSIIIESGINKSNEKYISVSDTGIGMSNDFMQKIFEPFSQEEQGYTRRFEGTGLGLSLVKKYVEINNYKIDVNSKKNEGTTFTISFPNSDL